VEAGGGGRSFGQGMGRKLDLFAWAQLLRGGRERELSRWYTKVVPRPRKGFPLLEGNPSLPISRGNGTSPEIFPGGGALS